MLRSLPVERILAAFCREQRMRFLVNGTPAPAIQVLSPEAFLPVIAVHAELSAGELLRKTGHFQPPARPLGTVIKPDESALLHCYAKVPGITGDGYGTLRITMFVHALLKVFGTGGAKLETAPIFERYESGLLAQLTAQTGTRSQEDPWPAAASPR